MQTVAREFKKVELARGVNRLIVTSEQEELPEGWDPQRIEGMREKIHQDFHGTALREEVFPNPPVRGRFGYAFIPLEENAIPQRQKPFQMYGKRQEALRMILSDWWEKRFIERPTKGGIEWLSQAFAVPKKIQNFPLEGSGGHERSKQPNEEV